jgi:hypothetical protein
MYFIQDGHPDSAAFQKSLLRCRPPAIFRPISTTGIQSAKNAEMKRSEQRVAAEHDPE